MAMAAPVTGPRCRRAGPTESYSSPPSRLAINDPGIRPAHAQPCPDSYTATRRIPHRYEPAAATRLSGAEDQHHRPTAPSTGGRRSATKCLDTRDPVLLPPRSTPCPGPTGNVGARRPPVVGHGLDRIPERQPTGGSRRRSRAGPGPTPTGERVAGRGTGGAEGDW